MVSKAEKLVADFLDAVSAAMDSLDADDGKGCPFEDLAEDHDFYPEPKDTEAPAESRRAVIVQVAYHPTAIFRTVLHPKADGWVVVPDNGNLGVYEGNEPIAAYAAGSWSHVYFDDAVSA